MVRPAIAQNVRIIRSPRTCISTVSRADPVSNIRLVRYEANPQQSLARCRLEARRLKATGVWNEFWTKHNLDYNKKLELLQKSYPKQEIPSAAMDDFYLQHLAEHRASHRSFNAWWIRENFALLFASMKCWSSERLLQTREPGFFGGH